MPGSPPKVVVLAASFAATAAIAGETKQVVLDVRAVVAYDAEKTAPPALARAVADAGYLAMVVSK
jgi:hypothetical protein